MKHTVKVTAILLGLFILTQLIGLTIIQAYINPEASQESKEVVYQSLPYNLETPEIEQQTSFIYIMIAILIGTALVLVLMKFKKVGIWKTWLFLSVTICLGIALSPFINPYIALAMGIILAAIKVWKPNIIVHNVTELFIYGGLAAFLVRIVNLPSMAILLLLIAIYDVIAVYKSKHMVKMAEFQTDAKLFSGLLVQYPKPKGTIAKKATPSTQKQKSAILGGGDIGFPLLFAGVVLKNLILTNPPPIAFLQTLIITATTTLSLGLLLWLSKKNRYYPAMPFLTAGCFLGYGILIIT